MFPDSQKVTVWSILRASFLPLRNKQDRKCSSARWQDFSHFVYPLSQYGQDPQWKPVLETMLKEKGKKWGQGVWEERRRWGRKRERFPKWTGYWQDVVDAWFQEHWVGAAGVSGLMGPTRRRTCKLRVCRHVTISQDRSRKYIKKAKWRW